jgi:hypothetical protein
MKKVYFNPTLTKAETVYLKKLKDRPADTIFREVVSKVQDYHNHPQEVINRQGS